MHRKHEDEKACKDRYGNLVLSSLCSLSLRKSGDRIIVVVQKSRTLGETGPSGGAGSVTAAKVRRGDIRHAIVVRTAKKVQRPDGMVVKFDDNACALIGKNGEPIGTRINGKSLAPYWRQRSRSIAAALFFDTMNQKYRVHLLMYFYAGVVGSELRDKKWSKILSLASQHV